MKKILAIVLSFMLLSSTATFVSAESDAQLIAYWNFDELSADNTIEDLSGNGNNLIMQDSSYEIVKGYSGNTFDFNGGSSAYDNSKHMVISSDILASQINGSSAVTITAVMKKEVKGSGTNFTMFALNAGSNSIMMYIQAAKMATSSRSDYSSPAMSTAADVIYPNIDDSTSPDGWMHVALVVDYANDNVKFYADGVLVGEEQAEATPQKFATDTANYKTDVNDITKGYFGVGGRHVLVDDVRIYRGALDEEDIKKNVPPVLEYDFEEINGGEIEDKGVNGMNIAVDGGELVEGVENSTLKLSSRGTLPVCTHRGLLYGAKQQSVSCWLRLSDGVLPSVAQAVFAEGESDGMRLELMPDGSVCLGGKSTAGDGYRTVATDSGVFDSGDTSWHHIYGDFDYVSKKGRIYINGSLAAEADLAFAGNYYNMSGGGSKADYIDLSSTAGIFMDSLRIYRRCLMESEIEELSSVLPLVKAELSAEGSSVTAVCDVVNLTGGDIPEGGMTLILGAFDRATNRMVGGSMINLPQIANYRGLDAQSITVNGLDNPSDLVYKLFVWHGLDGVASYQDETVLTIGETE
ncbi:MAG: hypothetical protein IJ460_08110 [Clostridia bacterium]|nr:hypothetical protein [Clostridia bacterium]